MANKLFGTADATLVRASFMHGASNIPKDLGAVYKQREANVKDFATGINEVFDKIYADDKATNDLLADVSDKSLKLMETGGVVNEYELTQHNNIINDYKQRLKDITREYGMGKGGDLERSKLRSEMNTYLANSQKDGETLTELTKAAKNNVLLSDVGDNKKELLTLIIQDENNGTNLTKPEYIKGEKYYSLPGTDMKMTMTELAEGFSIRDPKLLSNINKKLTNFVAKGKASGKAMTEDDALRFKNEIQGSMSSWDEIRNVGQEKFGNMKFTFEEVLTGRAKDANGNIDTDLLGYVYDELEKLGGADLDNDGDIDETDKSLLAQARADGKLYTDTKNGHTLIDAIKKDKQLYRDVMANYLTETAVRDSYGQGLDQFKPKVIKDGIDKESGLSLLKSNKSTELFGTNNGWTNNGVLNSLGTAINNRKNIPLAEGEGEMIWDDKAGYIYKDATGKTTIIDDKASLFQTFFQSETPISSSTLQGKWWKSIKGWGDGGSETIQTPITNLKDLKKAGIDKNIFMKPADDIIDEIKSVLPEDYDVITEKSGWGKKGDWMPFFRSVDQFIVTDSNGDKVGEFDTNYFKTPSKAKKELERFLKVMNENNALNISTEISSGGKLLD